MGHTVWTHSFMRSELVKALGHERWPKLLLVPIASLMLDPSRFPAPENR